MEKVKFGIIGCGGAAAYHLTGYKSKPEAKFRFVAAHDINNRQLRRFSKSHNLTPYNNLEDFLQSDIDAVLLMVPHYLHAQMTKEVAEAGKHVLCEKPMAPTLEECDEMIQTTKKAGVKFMIAENHRFLPAHQLIKDTLDQGLLGDIFLVRTYEGAYCDPQEFLDPDSWHFCFDTGGGGVVADQGVHKFATLNWILSDEVDFAQCWIGKSLNSPPNKGEDNAIILLHYKRGTMVEVTVSSTAVHPLTNKIELHGTRGTIFEDHSWELPVQIFSNHPEAKVIGKYYCPEIEHGPFPKYYFISTFHEDNYFANCILNDKLPEFTPEQAKEAVSVVLLAYLSAKKGTIAKIDELKKIYKHKGTKSILTDLNKFIQENFEKMNW